MATFERTSVARPDQIQYRATYYDEHGNEREIIEDTKIAYLKVHTTGHRGYYHVSVLKIEGGRRTLYYRTERGLTEDGKPWGRFVSIGRREFDDILSALWRKADAEAARINEYEMWGPGGRPF